MGRGKLIALWKLAAVTVALLFTAAACQSSSQPGPTPDVRSIPEVPAKPTPDQQELATLTPTPESRGDFEAELRGADINTFGWKTDFSKRSVPFSELISGGPPKDGIPAIDAPKFIPVSDVGWLDDREPVQVIDINGDVRAYPLQILMWHEIVNDEVGGVPVAVTFCPLCNTALVFDARLPDGRRLTFGVSGMLRFSDLVMYDRQTESWWQQATGEAIVGELTGTRLTFIPSSVVSWGEFKQAHSKGKVLSRDTGFSRPYGQNPYTGYDSSTPWLFIGPEDDRLRPTERVATVSIGALDVAFPFSVLEQEPVVHYTIGDRDIVVFYKKGTASALDSSLIAQGRDVGATGVFNPEARGRKLTFKADGDFFKDNETGTTWNLLGQAVAGELKGEKLEPVVHGNHFWFAWAVFKPNTIVYQGSQ